MIRYFREQFGYSCTSALAWANLVAVCHASSFRAQVLRDQHENDEPSRKDKVGYSKWEYSESVRIVKSKQCLFFTANRIATFKTFTHGKLLLGCRPVVLLIIVFSSSMRANLPTCRIHSHLMLKGCSLANEICPKRTQTTFGLIWGRCSLRSLGCWSRLIERF